MHLKVDIGSLDPWYDLLTMQATGEAYDSWYGYNYDGDADDNVKEGCCMIAQSALYITKNMSYLTVGTCNPLCTPFHARQCFNALTLASSFFKIRVSPIKASEDGSTTRHCHNHHSENECAHKARKIQESTFDDIEMAVDDNMCEELTTGYG